MANGPAPLLPRDRSLRSRPMIRAVAPGLVLVALGLVVFAGLLDAVREQDDLTRVDLPVLGWLVDRRGPGLTAVLEAITFVSGPTVLPILVAISAVVWAVVRHERWRPALLVAAMLGSTLLSLAVKGLVDRPRPPEDTMLVPGAESTASFPSGHTLGTATLLLVTAYLTTSRHDSARGLVGWVLGTVVGVVLVALSRLYLGYHFLTDVLASVALAIAVLGVVMVVDRIHLLRHQAAALPPGDPGGPDGRAPG